MRAPKLVTFAARRETVDAAIAAGADHVVLENPRVSVRTFADGCSGSPEELARYALNRYPGKGFSFNLDLLPQEEDLPLVEQTVDALARVGMTEYRVQDPGLALFIKETFKKSKFCFCPETGNGSPLAVNWLGKVENGLFSSLCLPSELDANDLKAIISGAWRGGPGLEYPVHGPILLQYSRRRLQHGGGTEKELAPKISWGRSVERPGRRLMFYDNPWGHFIFCWFDKCLLARIPALMEIGLDAWVIDGRGRPELYLAESLKAYRLSIASYLDNPQMWTADMKTINKLKFLSGVVSKCGFFNSNTTDKFKYVLDCDNVDSQAIGRVVDVIRGKFSTLEIEAGILRVGDKIRIVTPAGEEIKIKVEFLQNTAGQTLDSSEGESFVLVPWAARVVYASKVFRDG